MKSSMEKVETDIRMLREYKATLDGKASQGAVSLSIAIAVIGLLVAVAGILLKSA
jgi:hypothetical protein